MLKQINWKAVLYGFLWVISLSSLVVLMSFIEVKKSDVVCKDVRVLIPGNNNFVDRADIDNILFTAVGPLVGKTLNQLNIHRLETALKANPFIEFAKVYADMNGIIQVQIKQREPVIRMFNIADQDFYVDRNGIKIPTTANFTANVLVANGQIVENFTGTVDTLKTNLARDLYNVALFIEKDTLWREQIEQLYVNQENEIEMIPRVGNHRILLGNADSVQTKFTNLLMFYKKALPKVGWDTYKIINIKYANQVIGIKNNMITNLPDSLVVTKKSATDSIQVKTTTQDTVIN